ncbi:MAG: LVIVD repeat-containing protein [Halolamina sp.]
MTRHTDADDLSNSTRRTVLRAVGGALGVTGVAGAAGTASAHEKTNDDGGSYTGEHADRKTETLDTTADADVLGYHGLGGIGSERQAGRPSEAHDGAVSEVTVDGDYAYVGLISADGDSANRGLAVVDVGDYARAESPAAADDAEMTVLSYLTDVGPESAVMDVKVSDDGEYVFLGTQPVAVLLGDAGAGTNDDGDSTTGTNSGGVIAVDVSDPGNPAFAGSLETFSTGIHNVFHHRIGGDDYVFAVKDIEADGTAGMYVLRYDRTAETLVTVNRWTTDGDFVRAEVGTGGADWYCHDVEVQNDPVTGTPTAYLSYWNAGMQVLDVSDPTDIELVGFFDMEQCHFATPAPALVEGKRVAVASHEEPSNAYDDGNAAKTNPDSTGTVFLVDCDDIYATEGPTRCGELANWTWRDAADVDGDDVTFDNFILSPHNSDIQRHRVQDPDTGEVREEFWIHQAHYHAGLRYLRVVPGDDDGTTAPDGDRAHDATDWNLVEEGYVRPQEPVPESTTLEGLATVRPFMWGAVDLGGVTIAADINQGVFAATHDDLPIRGPTPLVDVEREDDGDAFTGGQTNRVDLRVDFAEESVLLRDRLPTDWGVVGGDPARTYEAGGAKIVEFEAAVDDGDVRTYFASVPADATDPSVDDLGPAEFSADGGDTWHAVPGTGDANVTTGSGTAAALGTVGLAGVFGAWRGR